jgi:hypothetical protein
VDRPIAASKHDLAVRDLDPEIAGVQSTVVAVTQRGEVLGD